MTRDEAKRNLNVGDVVRVARKVAPGSEAERARHLERVLELSVHEALLGQSPKRRSVALVFEGVRKESCERGILRGRVAAADLEACEQGVRIERGRTVALQQGGELGDQTVEQLSLVMVEPQAQSALRKGEQSHCAPACRTVAHNP